MKNYVYGLYLDDVKLDEIAMETNTPDEAKTFLLEDFGWRDKLGDQIAKATVELVDVEIEEDEHEYKNRCSDEDYE